MKISLPVAGLIGTLVSAVVVPASNYRSLKAAGEYVTHNWQIKIDEINVEVDCTGSMIRGGGKVDTEKKTKLKWNAKIDEVMKGKELMNGSEVVVSSNVELWTSRDGEALWNVIDTERAKKVALEIKNEREKLVVILKELFVEGNVKGGSHEFGKFTCEIKKGISGDGGKLYRARLTTIRLGETKSIITEDPVSINVKLGQCVWVERDRQFECNLDWSSDVTAKARISFE